MRGVAIALGLLALGAAGCGEDPTAPPPPVIAPRTATDLTTEQLASGPYAPAVRLYWTVPDSIAGGAPVHQFEVRSTTQTPVGDEWLAVPPALVLHTEIPPGGEVTAVLGALERGRTYAFVVRGLDDRSHWSGWSNVARFSTENAPPHAAFSVSADSTCPDVPVVVDASSSWDLQDPSRLLRVRWDWEGDGTWDTHWSTEKVASHRYSEARLFPVRLEVLDEGGWRSSIASRPVWRGPVLLARATRGFAYWEEYYDCPPPTSPPNPLPCTWIPREYGTSSSSLGLYTDDVGRFDQVSWVTVDSISFDAGARAQVSFPRIVNKAYLEVEFTVCAEVAYRLSGHGDDGGFSLAWAGPGRVLVDLPLGGSASGFEHQGTLEPGDYRLAAQVRSYSRLPPRRLRFSLVFGAAAVVP